MLLFYQDFNLIYHAFTFLVYFAKSSFGNPILPFNCCCSSDSRNVWERGIFKRKLKVCEFFRKFTKIGIAIFPLPDLIQAILICSLHTKKKRKSNNFYSSIQKSKFKKNPVFPTTTKKRFSWKPSKNLSNIFKFTVFMQKMKINHFYSSYHKTKKVWDWTT